MKLGLCIIVRDEAERLESCLADIVDLFDDIAIVDTGSVDGTPEILKDRLGITPLVAAAGSHETFGWTAARNLACSKVGTPWILMLDADERVTREGLQALKGMGDDPGVAGYFCEWRTFCNGSEIEDYKLPIFRKGMTYAGLIHENVQSHLRDRRLAAKWLSAFRIAHYPDERRMEVKRRLYVQRLRSALEQLPHWYRYHWFLGYNLLRHGDRDGARRLLMQAADSDSRAFPVECLNSKVVVAHLCAQDGDASQARLVLQSARDFHAQVAEDFEVRINFRLKPWIDRALEHCARLELDRIQPYEFMY